MQDTPHNGFDDFNDFIGSKDNWEDFILFFEFFILHASGEDLDTLIIFKGDFEDIFLFKDISDDPDLRSPSECKATHIRSNFSEDLEDFIFLYF